MACNQVHSTLSRKCVPLYLWW